MGDTVGFEDLIEIFGRSLEELEGANISSREYAAKYFDWRVMLKGVERI